MCIRVSKIFVLALLMSVASVGYAVSEEEMGLYSGLKVGKFSVDLSGVSEDTNAGLKLGYSFDVSNAIELEYIPGSGSVTAFVIVDDGSGIEVSETEVDIKASSLAIYWAYRSEGSVYILARVGWALLDSDIPSADDTGFSYSLGGGYRLSESISFELDYTKFEGYTNFIGMTGRYSF